MTVTRELLEPDQEWQFLYFLWMAERFTKLACYMLVSRQRTVPVSCNTWRIAQFFRTHHFWIFQKKETQLSSLLVSPPDNVACQVLNTYPKSSVVQQLQHLRKHLCGAIRLVTLAPCNLDITNSQARVLGKKTITSGYLPRRPCFFRHFRQVLAVEYKYEKLPKGVHFL